MAYVLLGALLMIMIKERDMRYRKSSKQKHSGPSSRCGIPHHNGLMFATAIAIVMEGVLSASYHVCPSPTNFQFGQRSFSIFQISQSVSFGFRHCVHVRDRNVGNAPDLPVPTPRCACRRPHRICYHRLLNFHFHDRSCESLNFSFPNIGLPSLDLKVF